MNKYMIRYRKINVLSFGQIQIALLSTKFTRKVIFVIAKMF